MKKEDLKKKAFDFASDTTKQLITISTALLALSVTFWDKFQGGGDKLVLILCWISLFISVLFGIWVLMALTGTLEKSTEDGKSKVELSVYGKNVSRPSSFQILFFLIGLLLLAVYGAQSLYADNHPGKNLSNHKSTDTLNIIPPEDLSDVKIDSLTKRVVQKSNFNNETTKVIDEENIYTKIIESQADTYNAIIVALLGIFALFAGATWLYNQKIAKDEIVKETDRVFQSEKESLVTEFRKEFNFELNFIQAESARLFAILNNGDTPRELVNQVVWWFRSIRFYKIANNGEGAGLSTDSLLRCLKSIKEENIEDMRKDFEETYSHEKDLFQEAINLLPEELLDEKKQIINLVNKIFQFQMTI